MNAWLENGCIWKVHGQLFFRLHYFFCPSCDVLLACHGVDEFVNFLPNDIASSLCLRRKLLKTLRGEKEVLVTT